MADMSYVTSNKLTEESDKKKHGNRKKVLMVGFVISISLFFVHIIFFVIALFFTFIIWFFQTGDEILQAGAEGEDKAIRILSQLPDEFTLLNQVNIPNAGSKFGFNEADIVILGPNAVFIIEVKHNNGHIYANVNDAEWNVEKIGRRGSMYTKKMRNPIAQVKKLVWLLSEEMKRTKSSGWIQGVVLFTHEDAIITIDQDSKVPVLNVDNIVEYIQDCNVSQAKSNHSRVTDCVKSLKASSV